MVVLTGFGARNLAAHRYSAARLRSTDGNGFTRRDLIRYSGAGAAGAAALTAAGCNLSDGDSNADKPAVQKVVAREGEPLNVLLIVTDSTRRDFVSIYGEDKLAHTPNLDALGKEGLVFDRAVPEAMPTVAVRRALLTGTRSFPFRDWNVAPKLPQFPGWSPIPAYKRIFTEFLDDAGIETAYVTDNPFLVGPRFERFRKTLDPEADLRPGRVPGLEHRSGPGQGRRARRSRTICCPRSRAPRRRSGSRRTWASTRAGGAISSQAP